ncbi:putative arylacetamide deacetylase [Rosellinia necatrix]|uniref:Putative arylacetamide deacetylase n=1 Tax=Rosellinia necatrix TaxID=77044 RepID=A0A1W2TTQ8_ROSNE|nr:putative arylacetamide deacetylase [Rosellinia necatrix]
MSTDAKHAAEVDTAEVTSIHDIGPPPVEEDYVNPAEKSPRWLLGAHAFAFRCLSSVGFRLANRSGLPAPPPTETIWLDSTLGEWKGEKTIGANVWIPPPNPQLSGGERRPAVINFHGGGYILGQGTDDSRWADALVRGLGAVVFSVNYRLAPGYPFPAPVEDCASAILQICQLADRYHIDADRVILSGFSAGATLALSSWVVLHDPAAWDYALPTPPPKIAGLVLYYPSLDWTLDRFQKRAACKRPDLTLQSSLTDLIDASYLHPPRPRRERGDPRMSPGLMPDGLVDRLPPVHLCLCEYDMLLAEGKLFAERLEGRGRKVSVRVVEGEKHAWDKPMPLAPKESVTFEYDISMAAVKSWFDGV